jgi:hypothetical protein
VVSACTWAVARPGNEATHKPQHAVRRSAFAAKQSRRTNVSSMQIITPLAGGKFWPAHRAVCRRFTSARGAPPGVNRKDPRAPGAAEPVKSPLTRRQRGPAATGTRARNRQTRKNARRSRLHRRRRPIFLRAARRIPSPVPGTDGSVSARRRRPSDLHPPRQGFLTPTELPRPQRCRARQPVPRARAHGCAAAGSRAAGIAPGFTDAAAGRVSRKGRLFVRLLQPQIIQSVPPPAPWGGVGFRTQPVSGPCTSPPSLRPSVAMAPTERMDRWWLQAMEQRHPWPRPRDRPPAM